MTRFTPFKSRRSARAPSDGEPTNAPAPHAYPAQMYPQPGNQAGPPHPAQHAQQYVHPQQQPFLPQQGFPQQQGPLPQQGYGHPPGIPPLQGFAQPQHLPPGMHPPPPHYPAGPHSPHPGLQHPPFAPGGFHNSPEGIHGPCPPYQAPPQQQHPVQYQPFHPNHHHHPHPHHHQYHHHHHQAHAGPSASGGFPPHHGPSPFPHYVPNGHPHNPPRPPRPPNGAPASHGCAQHLQSPPESPPPGAPHSPPSGAPQAPLDGAPLEVQPLSGCSVSGAFESADVGRVGKLSRDRFEAALTALGLNVSYRHLLHWFLFADKNEDGQICRREFDEAVLSLLALAVFELVAPPGANHIEVLGLRDAAKILGFGLTHEETLQLFRNEDTNLDLAICANELAGALRTLLRVRGKTVDYAVAHFKRHQAALCADRNRELLTRTHVSRVFRASDANCNGWLDIDEFVRALDSLGIDTGCGHSMLAAFFEADFDHDGKISHDEFLELFVGRSFTCAPVL